MPEVRGSGNVYDLRQAMARDAGLKELVSAFLNQSDAAKRNGLLDSILFRWAGATALDPASRGDAIDARKLVVLEQFLAEPFVGALGPNPVPEAAVRLERAYRDLSEQVYGKLMAQGQLDTLYQQITYRWDAAAGGIRADLSGVIAAIDAQLNADPAAGKALLSEFARTMRALGELPAADYQRLRNVYAARSEELAIAFDTGGLNVVSDVGSNRILGTTGADSLVGSAGNDSVMGYDGDDVVYGLDGDDTLSGCEDNDQIYGGTGNDNLFGGTGNDLMDGGAGRDYLNGGAGNDIYLLKRGGGGDHVRDYDATAGNLDIIRVAADLNRDDVNYWRSGDDLLVGVAGTADALQIEGWFLDVANRVEEVVFADGQRLTAGILAAAHFKGSAGADAVLGSADADVLEGLAGNDSLQGGYGNDVLDGGEGNDVLYGGFAGGMDWSGAGNDTYVFGRGYGQDVVIDHDTAAGNFDTVRLVGLNAADVTLLRKDNDLYIGINGTNDTLTVANWGSGAAHRIERIEFADGSVLEGASLANVPFLGTAGADNLTGSAESDTVAGLGGDDVLAGGYGDDVLDGGAGNDMLYGGFNVAASWAGAGNDTYLFGRGYGQDVVFDYDATAGNTDTVRLTGLNAGDVTIRRDAANLYIAVKGSSDQLRVANWGSGAAHRIERVQFADGSVLDGAALAGVEYLGTDAADTMTGTGESETLRGLGGDDVMAGGYGDDVLDGGAGNDILYGGFSGAYDWSGAGNDTYLFGRGYGQDVIYDYDTSAGNTDSVRLVGLKQSDVTIRRDNTNLYISVNGAADQLQVAGWGASAAYRIERVEFADGSVLDGAALAAAPFLGTAGADALTGTTGDDVIRGLGGNDVLSGGAGNDLIDGGTGNDMLYGGASGYQAGAGAGNDTYVFGRGYGQDVISDFDGTAGNVDTLLLSGLNPADVTIRRDATSLYVSVNGTADVLRVADWGMGAAYRIERILFADGSVMDQAALTQVPYLGTNGNDNITGTADNEVMRGFAGNDALGGGDGDDLLDGGDGTDTLKGDDGNDALIGGAGNDTLYGGDGNDLLDGGTGNDRLYGNGGDDVFWVDSSSGDKVYEYTNEGVDTVVSSVDYTLVDKPNVENVTLAGSAISATGNASSNVLRGNDAINVLSGGAGNDLLDGGAGADTMIGGAGNDTYVVDNALDLVVESPNEGIDTVQSSVNVTLGAFVENVTLLGSDAVNATGNDLANTLIGNSADNVLAGGAGQDVLQGGAGNDLLSGNAGADSLEGGAGVDVLQGHADNDTLRDAEGVGLLDGGTGADDIRSDGRASFVAGGKGDDLITVNGAASVVAHNRGDGKDCREPRRATGHAIPGRGHRLPGPGAAARRQEPGVRAGQRRQRHAGRLVRRDADQAQRGHACR